MVRTSLALALVMTMTGGAHAEALTEMERQRLLAHMEMTSQWLISEVSGLSAAQLEFRPSSASWSIAEVLDHLVVVGPIYWRDLQNALRTDAQRPAGFSNDADILWYGIDRTYREKAIPTELPKGPVRDLRSALDAYRKQHEQLVTYVKTTKDDLRSHLVRRQNSDAYQWALLISTHEQRHILQIREIKADARFPTK